MPTATKSRPDTMVRLLAVAVIAIAAAVAVFYATRGEDTPAGGDRELTITISNRTVSPPTGRVEVARGTTIKLTVTSDAPDELHVHGYDRKAALEPGKPAKLEFKADATGLFEVETHDAGLVLFQLVVR
ncbi:cupredoxin domain-containing protein [Dactylosporangium sp. NPDC005572]|uniref:cupredoxin domain-containing protein n=1 Tax=Dactylosporangium sp. NPDC005572 TaxID=3156889 RepID=UPI0033A4665B